MECPYKRVILHCGIHKTGSSYLQALLSANIKLLVGFGVEYAEFKNPDSKHFGNHSIIAVNYRGENDIFTFLRKFLRIEGLQPTLLISGEEFSRPHILEPFLTNLIAQVPSASVQLIYYLRRFDHLLESVYSESVKRTLVGGVERAAYELNFTNLVRPAVERVGSNNVIVRPYNRALWQRGVLGADFLHAIGIGEAFDEVTEGVNVERNVSFSRAHTFILSCISKRESKQKMVEFFQRRQFNVSDTSRYFMTPQRRTILNNSHIVRCQEYFATIGISDLSKFLAIEDVVNEPNWTPFVPDMPVINEYMREAINDGNLIDMDDFMNEVKKRA